MRDSVVFLSGRGRHFGSLWPGRPGTLKCFRRVDDNTLQVRLFAKAGGGDVGGCTVNLMFRPDAMDVLDGHVHAAEVARRDDTPAKITDDVPSESLPAAEVPQDVILTAEDKRQSSLLLEEAAWHIEEVARHMDSIHQASSKTLGCNFESSSPAGEQDM